MNFTETQPGVWFDDSKQYRIDTATLVKRRNGEPLYSPESYCADRQARSAVLDRLRRDAAVQVDECGGQSRQKAPRGLGLQRDGRRRSSWRAGKRTQ